MTSDASGRAATRCNQRLERSQVLLEWLPLASRFAVSAQRSRTLTAVIVNAPCSFRYCVARARTLGLLRDSSIALYRKAARGQQAFLDDRMGVLGHVDQRAARVAHREGVQVRGGAGHRQRDIEGQVGLVGFRGPTHQPHRRAVIPQPPAGFARGRVVKEGRSCDNVTQAFQSVICAQAQAGKPVSRLTTPSPPP